MNSESLQSLYDLEEQCLRLMQAIEAFKQASVGAQIDSPAENIISTIEHYYRIPAGSIRDKSRKMPIGEARLIAYHLLLTLNGMNYCQVGREMGKHHGTIISGERRVRELMEVDPKFRARVAALTKQLTQQERTA